MRFLLKKFLGVVFGAGILAISSGFYFSGAVFAEGESATCAWPGESDTSATWSDCSVTLESDQTIGVVIAVSGTVTVDLSNHTLTSTVSQGRPFKIADKTDADGNAITNSLTIKNGVMAISDSVTDSYGFIDLLAPATVTLADVSMSGDTDNGAFVRMRQGAEGSSITLFNVTATTNHMVFNSATDINQSNPVSLGTLTVSGGSYTVTKPENTSYNSETRTAFGLGNLMEATFSGVTITEDDAAGVQGWYGAEATFENCTITSSAGDALEAYGGAVFTVKSGAYTAGQYAAYAYAQEDSTSSWGAGTIIIEGGTFASTQANLMATDGGAVSVSGGTYTDVSSVGDFDDTIYMLLDNEDGTYTIVLVADYPESEYVIIRQEDGSVLARKITVEPDGDEPDNKDGDTEPTDGGDDTDSDSDSDPSETENPKTGDSIVIYATLTSLSLAGAGVVSCRARKA